ncbi:MAG: PEP-CTERM sorting domain-containing protein [Planctomyces sp.]
MIRSYFGVIPSLALLLFLLQSSVSVGGVLVTVSGKASPYLAGMPNGSSLPFGDTAPGQSPTQVAGVSIFGGASLQFDASGSTSYNSSQYNGPDGGFVFTRGSANGISGYTVTANALLGVFLDSNRPDLSAAPAALDFTTDSSRLYLSLSPALRQVFFIGDGIGAGGVRQTVIAPTGATRLFLGMADGSEWNNNGGSFSVTVSALPAGAAVPEPGAGLAVFLGAAVLAGMRIRRSCIMSSTLPNCHTDAGQTNPGMGSPE